MEVLDCIINRRSIRKFTNQEIETEKIDSILKSAMYAPTARDQRTFEFIIITETNILKDISELHPYMKLVKGANKVILVCHNSKKIKSDGFWKQDCAVASQNILLQSHNVGIGSVWIGVYERPDRVQALTNYFKLPEHITPFSLIALGYPDEKKETPERFEIEKIHFNKW